MTRRELNEMVEWAKAPVLSLGKPLGITMTDFLAEERYNLEQKKKKQPLTQEEEFHLSKEYRIQRLLEERDALIEGKRRADIVDKKILDYQLNELHMTPEEIERMDEEVREAKKLIREEYDASLPF